MWMRGESCSPRYEEVMYHASLGRDEFGKIIIY